MAGREDTEVLNDLLLVVVIVLSVIVLLAANGKFQIKGGPHDPASPAPLAVGAIP